MLRSNHQNQIELCGKSAIQEPLRLEANLSTSNVRLPTSDLNPKRNPLLTTGKFSWPSHKEMALPDQTLNYIRFNCLEGLYLPSCRAQLRRVTTPFTPYTRDIATGKDPAAPVLPKKKAGKKLPPEEAAASW